MEEEEREAQSAKLQELIRRGTPADLQEANRLMKVMAGFDNRHKTDYRAKAAEEVAKVQQKAKLLEEMLQGLKPGDKVAEGDVFEVLLTESSCCAVLEKGKRATHQFFLYPGTRRRTTERSSEDSEDV